MYDLKAEQMNVQRTWSQKLMLYEFELSHDISEETKNICCAKGKGSIDLSAVTRWLKKFRSSCKNLDD